MTKQKSGYLTKSLIILMVVTLLIGALLLGACDKNKDKNKNRVVQQGLTHSIETENDNRVLTILFSVTNNTTSAATLYPANYMLEIDNDPLQDIMIAYYMWRVEGTSAEFGNEPTIVVLAGQTANISIRFILPTNVNYAGREFELEYNNNSIYEQHFATNMAV